MCAGVAQLVELQPSKLNVASSSLVARSSLAPGFPINKHKPEIPNTAHVAQTVERFLGKEEVHRFDSGRGLHYESQPDRRNAPGRGGLKRQRIV